MLQGKRELPLARRAQLRIARRIFAAYALHSSSVGVVNTPPRARDVYVFFFPFLKWLLCTQNQYPNGKATISINKWRLDPLPSGCWAT